MTKKLEAEIMALINNQTKYNDKKELLLVVREHFEKVFAAEMQTNNKEVKVR